MDLLIEKTSLLTVTIAEIKSYKSRISEFISKYDEISLAAYNLAINEIEEILPKLKSMTESAGKLQIKEISILELPKLIDLYDIIGVIEKNISTTYEIISNTKWSSLATLGMSQTFNDELRSNLTSITQYIKQINSINQQLSQTFVADVKNKIVDSTKENEDNENKLTDILLNESAIKNDIIISILSKFNPTNAENIKKLSGYTEKLKNIILGATGKLSINNILPDGVVLPQEQQLLSRFSLMPVTEFMTKEEAYKLIGIKSFGEVPYGIGIVLLNKYSQTPIQYNILPLINQNYVIKNDLMTSETAGLNKKILKRFETIKLLSAENTTANLIPAERKPPRAINFHETKSADKNINIFVIEILNEKFYRFLSDKFGDGTAENIKISKHAARKIVNGVSDRPQKYMELTENIILERGVNRNHKKLMVSYAEKQIVSTSSNALKEELNIEYAKLFKNALDKKNPKSVTEVSLIMTKIAKKSREMLQKKVYNKTFNNSVLMRENGSAEMALSFASKFNSTYQFFLREMLSTIADVMSSGLVTDDLFKLNKAEVNATLIAAYKKIVYSTVEAMDVKPSKWVNVDMSLKSHSEDTGLYM